MRELKTYRLGTHRTISPRETVERLRPLLSKFGITRVANVTGLDRIGIPVVMVCRPNARSLSVSQGKGIDIDAARASGMMESIELFHAEEIDAPLRLGCESDLRENYPLIDVARLPKVLSGSYHRDYPVLWIEGKDLSNNASLWIPYEVVHLDFTLPRPAGEGCFAASSNGLASGNSWFEAISHGLCETIERDAGTLWRLKPRRERDTCRVDLATIDDAACLNVIDRIQKSGFRVTVWDQTSDIDMPVFSAVIQDIDGNGDGSRFGFQGTGCHPTREIALLRALTEAAQTRLTRISGARDDVTRESYDQLNDRKVITPDRRRIESAPMLRNFRLVPTYQGETFHDDVAWELNCLKRAGMEQVAVVDLTKPEFDIPVVRIVVPGLEGNRYNDQYQYGSRALQSQMKSTNSGANLSGTHQEPLAASTNVEAS